MAPHYLAIPLLAATLAYALAITVVTTTSFVTATPTTITTTTCDRGATSAPTMRGASTTAATVVVKRVSNTSGVVTASRRCDVMTRSTDFILWCVKGGGTSTLCCKTLLEAAESGGLMCLCDIAVTPVVMTSGYGVESILAAYSSCGGPLRMDPALAAKCDQ